MAVSSYSLAPLWTDVRREKAPELDIKSRRMWGRPYKGGIASVAPRYCLEISAGWLKSVNAGADFGHAHYSGRSENDPNGGFQQGAGKPDQAIAAGHHAIAASQPFVRQLASNLRLFRLYSSTAHYPFRRH